MTWAEVGFTVVSASDVKYKDQVCILLKLHPKSRTRISSATHTSLHRFPTSSIMKVISLAALLATAASVFALPAPAATSGSATVSYDQVYDNKSGSLDTVRHILSDAWLYANAPGPTDVFATHPHPTPQLHSTRCKAYRRTAASRPGPMPLANIVQGSLWRPRLHR